MTSHTDDTTRPASSTAAQPVPTGQQPTRHSGRIVAATTAAGLALAAICGAAVIAIGSPAASHAATVHRAQAAAADHRAPADDGTVVVPSRPSTGTGHSSGSSTAPSDNVRLLQQQLGELNYYEGPIDGVEGAQTIQSIKYLQRDAHLPQTGVMDQATVTAMDRMIATGSNLMGAG